jgi:hypothetical protein
MPKAVRRRYIAHHECDIRLRRMATTPTFYPYSPAPHRGIAQSAPVAQDVIKLAIDADEARAWFSETHACQQLRELFPAAIVFLIEDDYLGEKHKASIEQELAPAEVTWEPGYRIDGRHGR